MEARHEFLRAQLAHNLRLDRRKALRLLHWLHRLNDLSLVHRDVGMVGFEGSETGVRTLVATIDYATKEIGCSICGEWAANSGQVLHDGFRLVVLLPAYLPYDVRQLELHPAVLYCLPCWKEHREYLLWSYELDRDETEARERVLEAEVLKRKLDEYTPQPKRGEETPAPEEA